MKTCAVFTLVGEAQQPNQAAPMGRRIGPGRGDVRLLSEVLRSGRRIPVHREAAEAAPA
jgi:hypothetical protein